MIASRNLKNLDLESRSKYWFKTFFCLLRNLNISLLLSGCEKYNNCQITVCVKNRQKSTTIETDGRLKTVFIVREIFLAEHLFIYHMLIYTKPFRSKLHEIYICSDDLAKLIKRTVKKALQKPKERIKNHHVRQPTSGTTCYTTYRARFDESVGSFKVRQVNSDGTSETIKLYQYQACILYINQSLFNVYPCGPGFKKDKKYRKQKPAEGIPSIIRIQMKLKLPHHGTY